MDSYLKTPKEHIHLAHVLTRRPVCVPIISKPTGYSMTDNRERVTCPVCLLYGKGAAIGEKLRVPPKKSRKRIYRVIHE